MVSGEGRGPTSAKSGRIRPNQTCGVEKIKIVIKKEARGRRLAVGDEARPHPFPLHEHESKREPPHPDPLLHKCVEERKMERRARVLGINVGRRRIGGIRPNPTKSDLQRNGVVGGQWPVAKAGGRDRPNRAESNRIKPAAEMVEGGDYD